MTSPILVVGAGATGSYFGGRLALAGRDVTFLARPERVAALREHGLTLKTPDGEHHLSVRAVTPEDLAAEVARASDAAEAAGTGAPGAPAAGPGPLAVLITVKAGGLEWAIDAVATVLAAHPDAVIVPMLNGLAQLDACTEAFGRDRVLAGSMRVVASLDAVGAAVLHQPIYTLTLGELEPSGAPSPRVTQLAADLTVPGVDVVASPDMLNVLWQKWYFIVACGVVGCLARGPVSAIVAQPGGREFVQAVIAETVAVATACGWPPPAADIERTTAFLTDPTSSFVSSLYRDVVAGRPGETEHIVGDFVCRAQTRTVGIPLCELALLQMRVATARPAHPAH